MITNFKIFEKMGKIDPPLNIGYKFNEGMEGVLIGPDHFKDIIFIVNYFKEKNIKYRLLYKSERFLILIETESIEKLPYDLDYGKREYYVPFREGVGYGLGSFYQDMIEESNWSEITINNDEDIEELKTLISSSKYNL